MSRAYSSKSPRFSLFRAILFALWFGLIIPLGAYGVAYLKSETPLVRVSGETINSGTTNPVIDSTAAGTYVALEQRALLDVNNASPQSAAELERIRGQWAIAINVPVVKWDALAVAPTSPNTIAIAFRRDMFVSGNGGSSWEHHSNVLPGIVNAIAISPSNQNTVYAGLDGLGFYVSRDAGETWQPSNMGIQLMPGARFGITAITIDPYNAQNMFISTGVWLGTSHVTYHPLGILKTSDGGKTWTQIPTDTVRAFDRLLLDRDVIYAWDGVERASYRVP